MRKLWSRAAFAAFVAIVFATVVPQAARAQDNKKTPPAPAKKAAPAPVVPKKPDSTAPEAKPPAEGEVPPAAMPSPVEPPAPAPDAPPPPEAVTPPTGATKGKKPNATPKGPKPIVVERVVAIVNDSVILESEVYQRAAPQLGDLEQIQDPREKQKQFKALLRQTLDDMVDDELILQAAAESELNVTDEEVDKAVTEVKKGNKLTDAQLAEALQAQGYSMAGYRKDVHRQILRLRAVNVLVRPRVTVSDEDVKEAYEKQQRKAGAVTEVRVAHILISLPANASAEEKAAARRRATELLERAKGGEDFAKLALGSSEDASTKDQGGDLGWFKRGELPTEWETQLFVADKGDVRGPIEGPRGLHVFKVVDAKKDSIKPFDEVKDKLRNDMYADQMEKQTKVWLEELRRKAHIEIKL